MRLVTGYEELSNGMGSAREGGVKGRREKVGGGDGDELQLYSTLTHLCNVL